MAMKPEKIKSELIKNGITQAGIARSLDVGSSAVSLVISGKAKSKRIQQHIANLIGKNFKTVWEIKS